MRELGRTGPGPVPGADITARMNGCALFMLIFVCVVIGLALAFSSSVPVN